VSRSYKKAFIRISKRMVENVHSVARHRVKQTLRKMDPEEPEDLDLTVVDSDVRELGLEDYGTKFGLEFDKSLERSKTKRDMRRK
jgi:hypothetical protein